MKVKHSKYKNTGILFELLTRQLTADTIAGDQPKALNIIKKYFSGNSTLLKEYKIYHTFLNKKFKKESNATLLINTLIEAHNKLNKGILRREKNNFFKAKISNYKIIASIFNLLENNDASPLSIVDSKVTLLEHITGTLLSNKKKKDVVMEDYIKYDKDTRLLTYKVLLEKFNDKYSNLGNNQKSLLKEYVNNVTNSPTLKSYINSEIKSVKKSLTNYSQKVEDKAVSIKLKETRDMIKVLCKKSSVNDDNVINLLNYYEVVNELKTIH